jgi:putative transcriptional regulator
MDDDDIEGVARLLHDIVAANKRRRPQTRRFEPKSLYEPRPRRPPMRRTPNPFSDPFAPGGHRATPAGMRARQIRAARYPLEFAPMDVLDIRARFHATQEEFARMIGISVQTLRNWEQGKRRPQGPARALLRVAAANPQAVADALQRFRRAWFRSW